MYIMASTVCIPKAKIGQILDDVEKLVTNMEELLENEVVNNRLNDVRSGKVKGSSEKELDAYLKARGVKID